MNNSGVKSWSLKFSINFWKQSFETNMKLSAEVSLALKKTFF